MHVNGTKQIANGLMDDSVPVARPALYCWIATERGRAPGIINYHWLYDPSGYVPINEG